MDKIINVRKDWESYLEYCKSEHYFFNEDKCWYPHCALKYVCIENSYKFLKRKLSSGKYKVLYTWRPNLW